jgi:hypothetical protein
MRCSVKDTLRAREYSSGGRLFWTDELEDDGLILENARRPRLGLERLLKNVEPVISASGRQ